MDKVAMYKDYIEKVAARAWKAHIGELGEEAINKLKSSNILNHEKELAGLEKGTDNIVKHHGGTIGHFNENEVGDLMSKEIDSSGAIQKQMRLGGGTKQDYIDTVKDQHNLTNGFFTLNGTKTVVKGKLKDGNYLDQVLGGAPKDNFNKRYLEGIMNRHEADELRFGQNSMKGKKNNLIIGGTKTPIGQINSHMSPKVLGSESANVAVAPAEVKHKMNNMRLDESWGMKQRGLSYGQSGKYNKQLNAKMQRHEVAENKPMLSSLKD